MFLLAILLSIAAAFPVNLTCNANHYPPEFYMKYYKVASAVAGKQWHVTCTQWTDTTGNLEWVKIPNGTFKALMLSTFANGGVFTMFNVLDGPNIVFTENITLYAVTSDSQYSPMELCVWQTNPAFSDVNFYVPIIETGANLYTDTYINRFKTTAPAFYSSQTEYFAVSKDGEFMSNQLVHVDPKTGKGISMLSCVYDAFDTYPKQIGDWWAEPDAQPQRDSILHDVAKAHGLNIAHTNEDLVRIGRFRVPKSVLKNRQP
jgi:hypothetical protein